MGDYPPGYFVPDFSSPVIYHVSPDGKNVSIFSEGTVNPTATTIVPDEFTGHGDRLMFITQFLDGPLWEVAPDGSQQLVSMFDVSQIKSLTYIPKNFGGPPAGNLLITELSFGGVIRAGRSGVIYSVDENNNSSIYDPYIGIIGWSLTLAPSTFGKYSNLAFISSIGGVPPKILAMDLRSKKTYFFADVYLDDRQISLRHIAFSPVGWADFIDPVLQDESVLLVSITNVPTGTGDGAIAMFDQRGRMIASLSGLKDPAFNPRGITFDENRMLFTDFNNGLMLEANIHSFSPVDCDHNGLADLCEIDTGMQDDCNHDGVLDICEIESDPTLDCNENGFLDSCDIENGTNRDDNSNTIPDSCETTIYVDRDASGLDNGTSWKDAYQDLHAAITHAENLNGKPAQIWVAYGTYTPAPPNGDRSISYRMINHVGMYGGFSGDEQSFYHRDPKTNITILSGDLNNDDFIGGDNSENSYHVLTTTDTNHSAILDGFSVTGGHADGDFPSNSGAGLHNDGGSPTINECIFVNHLAYYGGAVSNGNYANPQFFRCSFVDNSAEYGGAVYNYRSSTQFNDCLFFNNQADEGGAINNIEYSGRINFTRCIITGNFASYSGGGINNDTSTTTLNSCLITDNRSNGSASAISNRYGYTNITNCTISNNHSDSSLGTAVFNGEEVVMEIFQSILWNNRSNSSDGEHSQLRNSGTLNIEYSTVEGWSGIHGGIGNTGDDPLFQNPLGKDDIPETEDDDYHLISGSPSINSGNPFYRLFENELDLDHHARFLCQGVDRGAYEFGIGDANCNQVIDRLDMNQWISCITGPDMMIAGEDCLSFDFDGDQDVDLFDVSGFMNELE